MDIDILKNIQQLFTLWTAKQQPGILLVSMDQLVWLAADGTEVNLTTLLQPIRTIPPPNPMMNRKQDKRLHEYYELGKQLQLYPEQTNQQSRTTIRTALRVYDFFQFIGEQHLGKLHSITPSRLYRLNNTQFETLKIETLASLITLGGPQAEEGDDLSSI
jgi:hypothetical protein